MTRGPHLSSYGPGDRFTIIKERLPSIVIHTKSKQHIYVRRRQKNESNGSRLSFERKEFHCVSIDATMNLVVLTLNH